MGSFILKCRQIMFGCSAKKVVVFLLIFKSFHLLGKEDYSKVSLREYKQRRQKLLNMLPKNSVACFFSADSKTRSNDVEYLYRQDNAIFYLTGFMEQNCVLILSKRTIKINGEKVNEVLFVRGKDSQNSDGKKLKGKNYNSEVWTGIRFSPDQAKEELGVQAVLLRKRFHSFFKNQIMHERFDNVYFYKHPLGNNSKHIISYEKRLNERVKNSYPLIAKLRMSKSQREVALIQKAIDITMNAHREAIKSCEEGITELGLKSVVEFIFGINGSEYPAFPSIIGSGRNSCILHYVPGHKKINSGDMVVMDIGAEYRGYAADITRTIPASGKFSDAQLQIYNLVLQAQEEAIKECVAGKDFKSPHYKAVEVIKNGLKKMRIIKKESDYIRYFMHGTSHYVGLDVHDAGFYKKLKENQIITVEPGIYIPENSPCNKKYWNIGVRIEDVVLITKDGYKVMSRNLIKKPNEIESLMKEKGIGNIVTKNNY